MSFGGLGTDLAIDLGTASTCVFALGRGVVVNEPSLIAFNTKTGAIEAVGDDAREMLGRTPDRLRAVRPIRDGVIADFDATEKMLTLFHPQDQPADWRLGAPASRLRRALADHAGRAPRGEGERLSRQGQRGLPGGRADGCCAWRRASDHGSGRKHDHRRRRRHHRHRRHLARRRRHQQVRARRRRRVRRCDHSAPETTS